MTDSMQEQYTKYMTEKRAKAEVKAREFFTNKKKRQTHFLFHGVNPEDEAIEFGLYYAYSPEEMTALVRLILDTYNKEYPSDSPITTLEELRQEMNLCDLQGLNPQLDDLLERCEDDGMQLYDLDPTPRYLYSMSLFFWTPYNQKISERRTFGVELTDEEYLYLLTEQLTDPDRYTFNRLVFERPDLAWKISYKADASLFDGLITNNGKPFLVLLDEIVEDAKRAASR